MTAITINDLVDSKELDQSAMAEVAGGLRFHYHRPRLYVRRHTHYRRHWTPRRGWHVHRTTHYHVARRPGSFHVHF